MAKAVYRIQGEDATGAAFRSVLGNAKTTADKMGAIWRTAFAGVSFAAVVGLGRQAIEAGDNLQKFTQKAKLSGESASSLAYAAKLADVELDGLGTSLQKMQIFISKANSGLEANVDTLDALGISITKLRDLKADQQFELIAEQVSKLRSEEDQTRAVTEIFGKSGAQLLPMFQQGAAGIREAREEAEKLGLIYSDDQLANLADADDAIKRLSTSAEHFAGVWTAKVAPAIAYALNRLSGVDKETAEQLADVEAELAQKPSAWAGLGGVFAIGKRMTPERRAELEKKRNLLWQKLLGESSSEMGVMPPAPDEPRPPGFTDTAEDERRAKAYADTMAKADEAIWDHHQDLLEDEMDARLKQEEILAEAQRDADETAAATRERLANEQFVKQQELQYLLSDQLTEAFIYGKEGWDDMLKYWAAKLISSGLDKMIGSIFANGIPGSGDGGGGGMGIAQGEWNWTKGTGWGGLGGILGFAGGGRPPVGRPSIVGENGPELFIPDSSGTIDPRVGGGRPSVHLSIHMDNRGASQDLIKMLPAFGRQLLDQAEARIAEGLAIGRYEQVQVR
jgi:hypothetical protein